MEKRPENPFYVGVVVVSPDRSKILLAKRTEDGKWTGPGGGAEMNETPRQAATREAFEEANLNLDVTTLEELPMRYARDGKCIHTFVAVLPTEQTPSPHNDPDREVKKWIWHPLSDRIPEPMDENRAGTILAAKMHLVGLQKGTSMENRVARLYERRPDLLARLTPEEQARLKARIRELSGMEVGEELEKGRLAPIGATSPDGKYVKTASGWQHKATGMKQHSVTMHLERDGKHYKKTVHGVEGHSHAHVMERMQGIVSGLTKKHPNLKVHQISIHNPEHAPAADGMSKSYAEAMDFFADEIAAQERTASERMELYRQFPEPQTIEGERQLQDLINALTLSKSISELTESLEKARPALPIGTVRIWAGQKYVKHSEGWIAVSGAHHGKRMGAFGQDPTHKEFADEHDEEVQGKKKAEAESKEKPSDSGSKAEDSAKPEKAEEPAHTPPAFKTYQEGLAWMKDAAKRYKSKDEFLASDEYKEAYSTLHALHMKEAAEASDIKPDPHDEEIKDVEEKPTAKSHSPEPLDADNPRKAAEAEEEENVADYEFARKSEIGNKGEDLLDSARHKRNEWRGLEQAEKDGTAEALVKRDTLMKSDPVDFIGEVSETNVLGPLAAYLTLKKFPPAPNIKKVANSEENFEKQQRQQYVEAFDRMKKKAASLKNSVNPVDVVKEMQLECGKIIGELRSKNRYNPIANQLVGYHNNVLSTYRARGSAVLGDLAQFATAAKTKYGPDYITNNRADLAEHAKTMMEGAGVDKAFGKAGKSKTGFKAADAYVGHAERKGPEDPALETKAGQEKALMDDMGMRGLQWGNSVTDEERKHHLKQAALAFSDLSEVLDLPKEMCSFNGRLGLAIGARGKGNALAHYEPNTKVINLTRKGGVGSLAHEWGHFFDNILHQIHGGSDSAGFFTNLAEGSRWRMNDESTPPVLKAMANLVTGPAWKNFTSRMRSSPEYRNMGDGQRQYWSSTIEVFARTFEKHVAHKLEEKGRKNTYLAGAMNDTLWPNKAETSEMAPLFDELFAAFKGSDMLKKALELLDLQYALQGELDHVNQDQAAQN